jgi:hypothetical protein
MRILWVKIGGLWPPDSGARSRSFQAISELSRRNEVILLTTHRCFDERAELRKALPSCRRVESIRYSGPKARSLRFAAALARSWLSPLPASLLRWRSRELQQGIARALSGGALDFCIVDSLASLANFPRRSSVPLVLFEPEVEHLVWKRLAGAERNPVKRAALELEWRKTQRYEARSCGRVRLTLTACEKDRALLASSAPEAPFRVLSAGADSWKQVFTGASHRDAAQDAIRRELPSPLRDRVKAS